MGLALQVVCALAVIGRRANLFEVRGRNDALTRPALTDQNLDAQPRVEPALLGPDARYLRPRVSLDHLLCAAETPPVRAGDKPHLHSYSSIVGDFPPPNHNPHPTHIQP